MKPASPIEIKRIKELAVIALFSNDELMDLLAFKGASAMEIVYLLDYRSSIDLDFSLEKNFPGNDLQKIQGMIEAALEKTFLPEGLIVFDVVLKEKPQQVTPDVADFWGGYELEFKVIEQDRFREMGKNLELARKAAEVVGPRSKRKVHVDISKFEYIAGKRAMDLKGFNISVYSPEMLALEKLRAICQQMDEYGQIVPNPSRRPRAKDFFDIYVLVTECKLNLSAPANLALMQIIFGAKRVPLSFLELIANYREYHRADFSSVRDTVRKDFKLLEFDRYFDFVLELAERLKPFGEK